MVGPSMVSLFFLFASWRRGCPSIQLGCEIATAPDTSRVLLLMPSHDRNTVRLPNVDVR